MNTMQTLKNLEEVTRVYEQELHDFNMAQLTQKPSEDEWSIGQVYVHLIQTALYMQIRNIETCLAANEEKPNFEKTAAGSAVFELGSFPPTKIHVPPSPQYTPSQPVDKEQIVTGLQTVIAKMQVIQAQLDVNSSKYTAAHPRLGDLNAKEWFQLIEMHFRHHRLQVNRLKESLAR
ncbi:DinB family protein [Paenibacillus sp. HWE-109]|uniref:DinB family protein n=1 Tax=Paenibacillus sp. HWE-109 TaxID=1306526 RepID=UPI001EDEE887|nr:DinB family protein [Paenibacillus sp. HWE-109]UKS29198.1 DinB family protein [Paenibacillus sp. HWE-109]